LENLPAGGYSIRVDGLHPLKSIPKKTFKMSVFAEKELAPL
jgi:hypothetical protein